ncbi:MAG: hypothetical protein K8F54_11795 [Altibacter sp.]|uniref:hypothetical protein n=1 Tax=Altibacter sp. TaxID=2024823 RepID=UPI001D918D7E|nr:hypothetical protein [Altibacter sp.]MBZ0328282.1 hypothetical protein [Altibacter sp.]
MYLPKVLYPEELLPNKRADHINQVWHAIMSMNIIEVAEALVDEVEFHESSKEEFLEMLSDRFRKHRILKDEKFYLNITHCFKIHKDEIIHEFIGMESGINLGLIFDITKDRITGVKFCNCFGGIFNLDNYYHW